MFTNSSIGRSVTLSLATRLILIIAGVVNSVITARALSVAERGDYFYIITLAGFAVQFGNLGLPSTNTYLLAKDLSLLPMLAANSFWVSLILGVITTCSVLFIKTGFTFGGFANENIYLLFIIVPTMLYGLLVGNLLIGASLIQCYNLYQLLNTTFQFIAVILVMRFKVGVTGLVSAIAVTGLVSMVGLMILVSRIRKLNFRLDLRLYAENLKYSFKTYLITTIGYLVSRVGVVVLERFSTREEVAFFSVGIQISDVLMVLPSTVAMVLFPNLLGSGNIDRFGETMRVAKKISVFLSISCIFAGAIAVVAIPRIFGIDYSPSVGVLFSMLPGVLCLGIANIISQFLAADGVPLTNLIAWLLVLCFLVISSCIGAINWGAIGVGACLSLAYFLLVVLLGGIAYSRR